MRNHVIMKLLFLTSVAIVITLDLGLLTALKINVHILCSVIIHNNYVFLKDIFISVLCSFVYVKSLRFNGGKFELFKFSLT